MTDAAVSEKAMSRLRADMTDATPTAPGALGVTMFDQPGSRDGTLTVLLASDQVRRAPAQSLVRIHSRDDKVYVGTVTAGPFALPDSLRPESPVLVTVATRGGDYTPPYHGRVEVTLLGERQADGSLAPPRLRPLPHSPVYPLGDEESAAVLKAGGDLRLGEAVGLKGVPVGVPTRSKAVLPRHLAVLGTTGSGKSTTVAGLIDGARAAGMAVVVLDVEGEYTTLDRPTDHPAMAARLREMMREPRGVPAADMTVYHLAGRETTNPDHANRREFSLQFARLSPYAVMELLGLNDAQTDRFLFAYEVAKGLMRKLGIFPQKDAPPEEQARQERLATELDEFERGWPRLTLSFFLDVVGVCKGIVNKAPFAPYNAELKSDAGQAAVKELIPDKSAVPANAASWGKVHNLLWRAHKLGVFHGSPKTRAKPISYADLLKPGRVSVVDLSDAGLSVLSNLAVADVLRGVQEEQEKAYRRFERGEAAEPPRVLIVVEEAHEFLSDERIDKMPVLFQQVSRLARRGRKRWLGLAFVTQLPQHLPRAVLGLCNSFVLHKLTDAAVVSGLKRTVGGIDDGLWGRLPTLAPGQAVVSFPHMTRPLLTAIDPAPGRLRMAD